MICRAICHENQSRHRLLHGQLIITPTWLMKTSITWLVSFGLQWNPVNVDTKETFHSVRIARVSVLSGLWEKMSSVCPRTRRHPRSSRSVARAWLISVLLYNRCFLYLPKFTSDSSTVCSILNLSISPPRAHSFIYLLSYFNTYLFTDLICSILVLDLFVLFVVVVVVFCNVRFPFRLMLLVT